jgi:hypothetical protein
MTSPGHVGIVTGHDTTIDAPFIGEVVREESFSGSTDLGALADVPLRDVQCRFSS